MSKYTKGPWKMVEHITGKDIVHLDIRPMSENRNLAYCTVAMGGAINEIVPLPTEESKANANLIASAPELLETLERIYDAQFNPKKTLSDLNSAINSSRILIAKAKGEV